MSFNVILGINHSENNKITKSVTTVATVQGTLRDKCSIVDPVIDITGDITSFASYNYLEIPSFRRKYFIKNISSVRSGLVSIECHCDVLSSFADAIKDSECITAKSASNWNLFLNDGSLRVNQGALYSTYYFPNGFTTQEFILAVAGG